MRFSLLFLLYSIWVLLISSFYSLLRGESLPSITLMSPTVLDVWETSILAPLWEEAVYRWAPLTFFSSLPPKKMFPLIVVISSIFGWGHGYGVEGILYQGVIGVILSYLFISSNYITCVLFHSLWNTLCLFFLDN